MRSLKHSSDFIVEDENRELKGVVSFKNHDLWKEELSPKEHLTAKDVLVKNIAAVTPDSNLYTALEKISQSDYDKIAIIEKIDSKEIVLGTLREKDIIRFYHRKFKDQARD